MSDEAKKLKLLIFTSPTCSACREMKKRKVVALFHQDNPDVEVEEVNVDTNKGSDTADLYDVQHMPTLVFEALDKPGEELARADAFQTLAALKGLHKKAQIKAGKQ